MPPKKAMKKPAVEHANLFVVGVEVKPTRPQGNVVPKRPAAQKTALCQKKTDTLTLTTTVVRKPGGSIKSPSSGIDKGMTEAKKDKTDAMWQNTCNKIREGIREEHIGFVAANDLSAESVKDLERIRNQINSLSGIVAVKTNHGSGSLKTVLSNLMHRYVEKLEPKASPPGATQVDAADESRAPPTFSSTISGTTPVPAWPSISGTTSVPAWSSLKEDLWCECLTHVESIRELGRLSSTSRTFQSLIAENDQLWQVLAFRLLSGTPMSSMFVVAVGSEVQNRQELERGGVERFGLAAQLKLNAMEAGHGPPSVICRSFREACAFSGDCELVLKLAEEVKHTAQKYLDMCLPDLNMCYHLGGNVNMVDIHEHTSPGNRLMSPEEHVAGKITACLMEDCRDAEDFRRWVRTERTVINRFLYYDKDNIPEKSFLSLGQVLKEMDIDVCGALKSDKRYYPGLNRRLNAVTVGKLCAFIMCWGHSMHAYHGISKIVPPYREVLRAVEDCSLEMLQYVHKCPLVVLPG